MPGLAFKALQSLAPKLSFPPLSATFPKLGPSSFGQRLDTMPEPTAAYQHGTSPPSSPGGQKKPNSRHPADCHWATIKGPTVSALLGPQQGQERERRPHLHWLSGCSESVTSCPLQLPTCRDRGPQPDEAAGSRWPLPGAGGPPVLSGCTLQALPIRG